MPKFKSRYPNKMYERCYFNSNCECVVSEQQAVALRKSTLVRTGDITEIIEAPVIEPVVEEIKEPEEEQLPEVKEPEQKKRGK